MDKLIDPSNRENTDETAGKGTPRPSRRTFLWRAATSIFGLVAFGATSGRALASDESFLNELLATGTVNVLSPKPRPIGLAVTQTTDNFHAPVAGVVYVGERMKITVADIPHHTIDHLTLTSDTGIGKMIMANDTIPLTVGPDNIGTFIYDVPLDYSTAQRHVTLILTATGVPNPVMSLTFDILPNG